MKNKILNLCISVGFNLINENNYRTLYTKHYNEYQYNLFITDETLNITRITDDSYPEHLFDKNECLFKNLNYDIVYQTFQRWFKEDMRNLKIKSLLKL